jgi:hypothetical protein
MSQLEEAVACLTQARSKLAPITERLLDIETRLAVVKDALERPAKISLRAFTSNLFNQKQHYSPSTIMVEKYGMAVRQTGRR